MQKKAESEGKCITLPPGFHFLDTYFESPSELFFRRAWSCHISSNHEFIKVYGPAGVFVENAKDVIDKVFRIAQWWYFIVDFHDGFFVKHSFGTFLSKILMPFPVKAEISHTQKMHSFPEFPFSDAATTLKKEKTFATRAHQNNIQNDF